MVEIIPCTHGVLHLLIWHWPTIDVLHASSHFFPPAVPFSMHACFFFPFVSCLRSPWRLEFGFTSTLISFSDQASHKTFCQVLHLNLDCWFLFFFYFIFLFLLWQMFYSCVCIRMISSWTLIRSSQFEDLFLLLLLFVLCVFFLLFLPLKSLVIAPELR